MSFNKVMNDKVRYACITRTELELYTALIFIFSFLLGAVWEHMVRW